jgi:hypothetical protein
MTHECVICNKNYKTPQSLWNHKNKFHQQKLVDNNINEKPKVQNKDFPCLNCGKLFSCIQSRWKHKNTSCVLKSTLLKDELAIIKKDISELKNKQEPENVKIESIDKVMVFNNKEYFVDNFNVYDKTTDNKRGQLVGIFLDNEFYRIKKNTNVE